MKFSKPPKDKIFFISVAKWLAIDNWPTGLHRALSAAAVPTKRYYVGLTIAISNTPDTRHEQAAYSLAQTAFYAAKIQQADPPNGSKLHHFQLFVYLATPQSAAC